MIPVIEAGARPPAIKWPATRLGYPVATVVVGVARDQDGRDTTGDEDGTAR
jgi:hypothetical protein